MDAEKREEIKDLVRMMHAELSKECLPLNLLRSDIKTVGWKVVALIALAGATGGTASELLGWLKAASVAAQAVGASP